jgi:alanine racemase
MPRLPASNQPIYVDRSRTSLSAWVDVDVSAVRRNSDRLRTKAGLPLVAMVKADGYGLGMLPVVRALGASFRDDDPAKRPADAPWAFGVATLQEAAALRDAGCIDRVLITTPISLRDLSDAQELDVRPALHRPEDIVAWSALSGGAWHLSIDTGMSRAGVRWDQVANLLSVLEEHPPEGVFTHFHSAERADGSREQQEARFVAARNTLGRVLPKRALVHSDNSAAIVARGSGAPGHLVRPGIGLYGATIAPHLDVEQTVHLRARIVDIREIDAGDSVSYGATWTASGPRRIATVPVGYADGYRRALSNRGIAFFRGQAVPVVGVVTMDMTMLDVTEVAGPCVVGDLVTLMGRDGAMLLSTDEVAARAELSPYELLVGLGLRLPRLYLDETA